MINTSKLKNKDKVNITLCNGKNIRCEFINGLFVNIEDGVHKDEIYGSSAIKFEKKPLCDIIKYLMSSKTLDMWIEYSGDNTYRDTLVEIDNTILYGTVYPVYDDEIL